MDLGKFSNALDQIASKRNIEEAEYFMQNPPQKEIEIKEYEDKIQVGFWFHENGVTTCRKMSNGYHTRDFSHIPSEFIQVILEFYQL